MDAFFQMSITLQQKKDLAPHCLSLSHSLANNNPLSLSFSFYHFYLIYLSLRYLSPLSLSNESLLTLLLHLYSLNLSLDVSHICLFINKLSSSLSLCTHTVSLNSLPLSLCHSFSLSFKTAQRRLRYVILLMIVQN